METALDEVTAELAKIGIAPLAYTIDAQFTVRLSPSPFVFFLGGEAEVEASHATTRVRKGTGQVKERGRRLLVTRKKQ